MNNETEPPKRLRKGHRRCSQIQCSFYIGLVKTEGCPVCSKCGARPFEINESCSTCINCESIPNCLRNKDNKVEGVKMPEVILEKVPEVKKEVLPEIKVR